MSIYEDGSLMNRPVEFGTGDPLDVFARLLVYVPFDTDTRNRRPIEETVPGHPGLWICVYSTFSRLSAARHEESPEYSEMLGERLFALASDHTGIWLDRSYPGGRKILIPPVDISVGAT